MAANKIFLIGQLPLLTPSTCLNITQRNYIKQRTLLKKLGYPEKPKKPCTGYITFARSNRDSVAAQNPDLSFAEISCILGQKWRDLPGSERQKYNDEFQRKLAEYKLKMEEYNKCLTEKQKEELRDLNTEYVASKKENSIINDVKKMEKQLKKPKNPVSPFVLFCSKNADNFQGQGKLKSCAEKWRNASEAEKLKYKTLFNKEYEQYKKDLLKWEEQMMQQGNLDLIRLKTLKEKLKTSN